MLTRHRTRALLATTALAAVLATGACSALGSDSQDSSTGRVEPADARAGAGAEPAEGGGDQAERADGAGQDALSNQLSDSADTADTAAQSGGQDQPADPQQRAIIATGTISLHAKDVADARFEVQKILDTHQGTISNEETSTADDGELETARLVLRIPSDQVQEATAALEKVGELASSSYGEEDVTTEVIDVAARIRAQEKSVRRIEALLAEAENLRTLMSIEQELSRRQAELDSLKSQQKWLADQTDLATITVHLERSAEAEEKDTDRAGFLGGLSDGWDSFVAAASGTALVLGFLLPWLMVLVVVGGAAWLVLRTTRRRQPVPAPAADAGGE